MHEGRGLPSGTMVAGKWRIERMLGAGGFGVSYEARNRRTGAHVALKEYMPSGLCTRPVGSTGVTPAQGPAGDIFKRGLAGFMKEAETLARLDHPSIVRVTEYFEANGTAYMALAYLQGGSVASWLKRLGRRPTQAELDQLLWPLTDALREVHALFVLHRDIKPDNIMLGADGLPVLIDFGAIKSLVSSETRSIGAGTLNLVTDGFAPPEQYVPDGESLLGPWTDVYALGATVYQAITGAPPPSSPRRQIEDTYRPLSTLSPEQIGTGWRPMFLAGIDRSLSLKRSDRPQSAMELRSFLGLTFTPAHKTAHSEIAEELAAGPEPSKPPMREAVAEVLQSALGEPGPEGLWQLVRRRIWQIASEVAGIALILGSIAAADGGKNWTAATQSLALVGIAFVLIGGALFFFEKPPRSEL